MTNSFHEAYSAMSSKDHLDLEVAYNLGFEAGAKGILSFLERWMHNEGCEFWLTSFKSGEAAALALVDNSEFIKLATKSIEHYKLVNGEEKNECERR